MNAPRAQIAMGKVIVLVTVAALAGMVLLAETRAVFEIAVLLLFGWLGFIYTTWSQSVPDWWLVGSGAIGLFLACLVLHGVMHSLVRSPNSDYAWRWRTKWTLAAAALLVMLFGICVSAAGIAQNTAWLQSAPWFSSDGGRSPVARDIVSAKTLALHARLIASEQGGRFPSDWKQLAQGVRDKRMLELCSALPSDGVVVSEPWTYLGGLTVEAPEDVPMLMSPRPVLRGCRIVAFCDTTVKLCNEEEWEAALARWRSACEKQRLQAVTSQTPTSRGR